MATLQTLAKARKLCKNYKINFRFSDKEACYAMPWKSYIHVCKRLSNREFISGLFHEIQHCLNFRNKKYMMYHKGKQKKEVLKRWALTAELYTDKQALNLAKKHGFMNFVPSYKNTPEHKQFLMEYIDAL